MKDWEIRFYRNFEEFPMETKAYEKYLKYGFLLGWCEAFHQLQYEIDNLNEKQEVINKYTKDIK